VTSRRRLEQVEPEVGLASAMAISGAAAPPRPIWAEPTIRPLTLSLALPEIPSGFWFPNPAGLPTRQPMWKTGRADGIGSFYRGFSRLDERSLNVYLTDGGTRRKTSPSMAGTAALQR